MRRLPRDDSFAVTYGSAEVLEESEVRRQESASLATSNPQIAQIAQIENEKQVLRFPRLRSGQAAQDDRVG